MVFGALIVGCDSSEGNQDTDGNTIPEGTGLISGIVTDQNGIPVEGVSIEIGDDSVKTDDTGRFSLEAKPGSRVVHFSKKGYAESSVAALVTDGADTPLSEGLVKRNNPVKTNIDSEETVGENARVTLKSGSLVLEDGTAAEGEISAYITPLDVMGNLTAAPGDFSAVKKGGEETRLETLSMAEYYFEDKDGNPLNVADGETLEIELALPVELEAEEGDTIPAWHFDVETGKWQEDGEGEVVDDGNGGLVWRALVSHFSFWNADKPIDERDCVSGTITDCNGDAVPGATVTAKGMSYRGESSAYPGLSSSYCVDIKRGSEADILVVGTVNGNKVGKRVAVTGKDGGTSCEEGTGGCTEQNIKLPCDPEESDLDCGDSPDLPCKACVSGRIVTADGDAIEDAVISLSNDDNGFGQLGMGESDGGFCLPAPLNAPMVVTVNAAGYPPTSVTVTATEKGECPDCTDVGDIVLEKGGDTGDTVFEKCNETELTVDSVDLDGADEILANLPYLGMLVFDPEDGNPLTGYLWMSNSDTPDDTTGSSSILVSFEIPVGAGAGESTDLTGFGNYNANGVAGVNSEQYLVETGSISWNETVDGAGQTLTGDWTFEMTTQCGMALRTMTFSGSFSTNIIDIGTYISETTGCMDELLRYYSALSSSTTGVVTAEVNGTALSFVSPSVVYSPNDNKLSVIASEEEGYMFILTKEGAVFGTQNITDIFMSDSATSCIYEATEAPELIIEENDASDLGVAPVQGSFTAELTVPAEYVGVIEGCEDSLAVSGTFISAICSYSL
jgi:protocatechuate 3,4-dioxygenase beta subunit